MTNTRTVSTGNWFFAILMMAASLGFVVWGLDFTHYERVGLFLISTFFGLFMAFNIGGNDVANSFGTSVGAGTLSVPQALVIAAIFEVSGAVLAGSEVTNTIKKGVVDIDSIGGASPDQFIFVMLSALIAAGIWLLIATKKGLPVSTTHSIIGGMMGSSILLGISFGGFETALGAIKWGTMGKIAISWILSPLLGGIFSYLLYQFIIKNKILAYNDQMENHIKELKAQKKALKKTSKAYKNSLDDQDKLAYATALLADQEHFGDRDCERENLETAYYRDLYDLEAKRDALDTIKALRTWVPIVAAGGGVMMTALVVFKGLKKSGLSFTTLQASMLMGLIGAMLYMTAFVYTRTIRGKHKENLSKATFILFSWMQVFTACAFAFSHGSNDIANAVGPFMGILDVLKSGAISDSSSVPGPVIVVFGISLIVGLWFVGKEVIATVGTKLAEMHPASGFSAELAAAAVVMGASSLGLPVSSTHILVGAVLGIGIANANTNWKLMKPIALTWVITLPSAALISAVSYMLLGMLF